MSSEQSLLKPSTTEINASWTFTAHAFISFIHIFTQSSSMYCGHTCAKHYTAILKHAEKCHKNRRVGLWEHTVRNARHPRTSLSWVSLPWIGCLLANLPDLGILISSAPLTPRHMAWHAADKHLDFYTKKVIHSYRARAVC